MKIYSITNQGGEKEWVAAQDPIAVVFAYLAAYDCNILELYGSTMAELNDGEWPKHFVDGAPETSFLEWMEQNPEGGLIEARQNNQTEP